MLVARAATAVETIGSARSRRAFLGAIVYFERMLAIAPGYPGDFFNAVDFEKLRALADTAIEHIERRLDARTDRASVQRDLAANVYRIQADIDTIYGRVPHTPLAGIRHGTATERRSSLPRDRSRRAS
jgi:hypothetical protein